MGSAVCTTGAKSNSFQRIGSYEQPKNQLHPIQWFFLTPSRGLYVLAFHPSLSAADYYVIDKRVYCMFMGFNVSKTNHAEQFLEPIQKGIRLRILCNQHWWVSVAESCHVRSGYCLHVINVLFNARVIQREFIFMQNMLETFFKYFKPVQFPQQTEFKPISLSALISFIQLAEKYSGKTIHTFSAKPEDRTHPLCRHITNQNVIPSKKKNRSNHI